MREQEHFPALVPFPNGYSSENWDHLKPGLLPGLPPGYRGPRPWAKISISLIDEVINLF